MKTNIINTKSILPNSFRFDPSFHLSEAIILGKDLDNVPYEKISIKDTNSKVFLGNIFSRIFVKDKEHGIPYLAASDTVLADINTGRFLSKKQSKELAYLMLKKDWIVITCSGTIGNVTYTNSTFENHIATHDLIRIVPNDEKILKGYLYAFLSSKYGYNQLTQSRFGGVVKHINADHVNGITLPLFPEPFQKEVDDLIQESARLREEATEVLDKAKDILSKYINVSFNKEHFKTSVVSSKDIWNSLQHRLDPPAIMNDGVYSMQDITSKMNYTTIANINGKVYRPGIFKRNYVSNGIPYIKGSEIFLTNPFRRCEQLSRTLTPFIDEMSMKEGQILITCAGSVGDIKLITKEYEDKKSIGSQDIIRLESNDELYTKEYLFVYLQQPFVYDYIQSMKYGSVIERIEPFHVESIPVIEPTKELSDEITSIVRHYMDCTYQAFKREEKAISMVEEEIEKWNKN